MAMTALRRRTILATGAASLLSRRARAATAPVRMLSNWYAQAEHAGFYQAHAKGFYHEAGIDVVLDHGGPQINDVQLLLPGHYDVILGGVDTAMIGAARNMPEVTIAATFQKSLIGLVVHPDIKQVQDLKGHTILLSTEVRGTLWPWVRTHFGFDDAQVRPYSYSVQPFVVDPTIAMQAFMTSEPYALQKKNIPFHFIPFSDFVQADYGNPIVTTRETITQRRDDLAKFLQATMRGWADWLSGDPRPGNDAIRAANPMMTEEQILWSRQQFRALDAFGKPGTRIGPLDRARCLKIRDFLVQSNQLPASAAWEQSIDYSFAAAMNAIYS